MFDFVNVKLNKIKCWLFGSRKRVEHNCCAAAVKEIETDAFHPVLIKTL
jgi:hypothetical protein